MQTQIELEQEIIRLSNIIHPNLPELSQYIQGFPAGTESANDLKEYCAFLNGLFKKHFQTGNSATENNEEKSFPGYPIYPPSDDIFEKGKKEGDLNPEDLSKNKTPNGEEGTMNEKGFEDDMTGADLDVPGSDLDDQQESVGSEDEENNYYSLGGDNHNDLEEDNG